MPKPLTKKDIKDVVVEVLAPFSKAIQADYKKVDNRLGSLETKASSLQVDMREVKQRIKSLEESHNRLLNTMDKILAKYDKQDQEMLFMSAHVKRLEARVVELEKRLHINS